MPYSLNELGEVVSDADGVSWADAIKQQRALHSNASRVASMYAELDAIAEEVLPIPVVIAEKQSELVKVVVGGTESDPAITASLVQALDVISRRLEAAERVTDSMVASMHAMAEHPTNVTVEAPNVTVEPAAITVEQPEITVRPPEVRVEVKAPNVSVNPEIVLPSASKTITFERDFDGRVTKADVVEG